VLARGGAVWEDIDPTEWDAYAPDAGFTVLIRIKRKKPGVVESIFLNPNFPDPPYGFSFTSRTELLKSMPKPTEKERTYDSWTFDGLAVSAHYEKGRVTELVLQSLESLA
jgi:hypothetical protein